MGAGPGNVIPSTSTQKGPLPVPELPQNAWGGRCLLLPHTGTGSQATEDHSTGSCPGLPKAPIGGASTLTPGSSSGGRSFSKQQRLLPSVAPVKEEEVSQAGYTQVDYLQPDGGI